MSRIIKGSSAPVCKKWRVPAMAGLPGGASGGADPAVRVDEIREAARLEGFRQGLAQAREAGAEQATRFETLLARLARPFEGFEDQLEEEVIALVSALTRQLVRREMRSDPAQVIGVIREAVRTLPNTTMELQVRLHPDDANLVREYLETEQGRRSWHIQEDPALARGDCHVSNANTEVDATLDSRLGRMLAEMLGSQRAEDS